MNSEETPQPNRRKLIIVVSLIVCVCLAIPFIFAYEYPRADGEWANQDVVLAPPNSVIIREETDISDGYEYQTTIYHMPASLQTARDWFRDYLLLPPVDDRLDESDTQYISLQPPQPSIYEYLWRRIFASTTPSSAYWDYGLECFSAELYTPDAFAESDHIDHYNLSTLNQAETSMERGTIAVVNRCWSSQ